MAAERALIRGSIWFVKLPTDPPGKGPRPVVIVSENTRNHHEKADTVLVIPLTTSIHKLGVPTHLYLAEGETGLQAPSAAKAEDITVIRKTSLIAPRSALRQLSNTQICSLGDKVKIAMGCYPA